MILKTYTTKRLKTNQMTKQEKIQEAYGEYFEQIKDWVNIDGWFYLGDTDFRLDNKMPLEFDALNNKMRPLSLQGIEKNRGWIKIESEEDLPKKTINYNVVINGKLSKALYAGKNRWFINGNDFPKTTEIQGITHYKEIKIEEPPIY